MNRIELKYIKKEDGGSTLEIFNDLKGYTYEQIGDTYYGREADIMFELLSNVDYSKTKNCMNYGIYINGEKAIQEDKNLICCLCGEECENEWGNNPYPVDTNSDHRCCDICNSTKVIPARLNAFTAERMELQNEGNK